MRRVGRPASIRLPGRKRSRVVALIVLAIAGAAIALTLTPSTDVNTFVSSSSSDYQATQAMYRQFGADPVVVLVRGNVDGLLSEANIKTLSRLEACLAGQGLRLDSSLEAYLPVTGSAAKAQGGAGSACAKLMALRAAKVVYGPASFLNHAVAAVNTEVGSLTVSAVATVREAEAEARTLAKQQKLDKAQTSAAVEAAGELALENDLATDEGTSSSTKTKSKTGSSDSSSASSTAALLDNVPSINDQSFLRQIVFGSTTNTSTPAARFAYLFPNGDASVIQIRLRSSLSEDQQREAIGWIREAVESPQFRINGVSYTVTGEPALLSDLGSEISGQLILLLAVAVVVMAIVLLAVFRRRLRLLPLLTALAAVAITIGLTGLFGGSLTLADVAVFPVLLGLAVDYGVQFRSGTPKGAVAIACLATAAGFLALLVSAVPMVRGFGLLLVVGVVVAFAAASVGSPDGNITPAERLEPSRLIPEPLLASILGAGEILSGLIPALLRHPRRVLSIAAALAVAGWVLSTHTAVQSDITKLVPSNMPALSRLEQLERTTGTSGEVDVLVSGANVSSAKDVAWMRSYERRMSARFGASSCTSATLCPALSLPSLLQTAGGTLSGVPGYFQRSVLTSNHHYALLAFGIRLMPLDRQRRVVEQMRAALDPPAGTAAQLAGLPVLAADAEGSLSSSSDRLLMLALSLVLVAAALMAALRQPRRVLVPLIPIVFATGWSALLVYVLRIPLNPMSATLGTLVIAITTEFSVLLSERVCRQQGVGMTSAEAIDDAYRTTGIAVLTSGLTAIAGFAVLVVSNITMLRDFGLLALVDLSASLAGVMLVLPAALGLVDLKRPRKRRGSPAPPGGTREQQPELAAR